MVSSFESPIIRYGLGLSSAAVLAVVALVFLDGTMRWIVLGFAAFEAVIFPQFLKMGTT
jgi:hypothetical protein